MSSTRHRDDRRLYAFHGETLLVCPACARLALSSTVNPGDTDWFAPRRLVCASCGHSRSWVSSSIERRWRSDPVRDDFFDLPLWLQTRCCGEILWAYNTDHLAFLEAFVGARLRERRRSEKFGWSNGALMSRLPLWLKSRKNREEVLAGIARLRETLKGGIYGRYS